ncbi:hypothetical protein EDB81DRAFT_900691 [Dactylonectria macrodidyma]|uniref:Uncharacterized protein n=1 Tax=Dactylonectria macrodidyma TaxID=307937 RepID=A0A9P9J3U9_9HYPO|nr:hypothetical protein EDB81DRAFT_900691 [Dactylonectria macrodidyma]
MLAAYTLGLLRAVSADNVNPNAVIQVQAIGSCFHSNRPWAAKLPDLMSRASCVRLERLSTWIGWAKDDTSSFMSQTAGGRTAALLCCALGSLYSKDRCGMILFDVSRDILPLEQQTSSPAQLGDACMVLEALQLTRLRQCFFEADLEVPRDLADTPTEKDMHAFLNWVKDALQDEILVLQVSGTKCSGIFLSLVLAMCPEDVSVQVNGEIIMRGRQDNIVFSITSTQRLTTEIHLETKLKSNTADFRKSYIIVEGEHELNPQINFSLDGILSSQLDIVLAMVCADPKESLKPAVANLIASMAISFTRKDFCSHQVNPYGYFASTRFPAQGLSVVVGPTYRQTIRERLQKVLCCPSDTLQVPELEYKTLCNIISTALPLSHCTCEICHNGDPWNPLKHPKSNIHAREAWKLCAVARLWGTIGQIAHAALLILFVQASPNSSMRLWTEGRYSSPFADYLWKVFDKNPWVYDFRPLSVHTSILEMTRRWRNLSEDQPPIICSSSTMPERRAMRKLARMKAKTSITKGTVTAPSGLGEHSSLLMTLRPALMEGCQALLLRCHIKQANSTMDIDFLDIHIGLMSLTPGDGCEHDISTPLTLSDYAQPVKATSVIAPVASGAKAIGITLTHRNEESQFLCCSQAVSQLYQGDCCMPCAIAQAQWEAYSVVIGGSPGTYYIMESEMTS